MQLISSPVQILTGNVDLPGDKSLSHRAVLFASLAEGESYIDNFLSAGVTDVMIYALKTLGVRIIREKNTLTVQGCGIGGYLNPGKDLDCGSSATTVRLLAGALAAAGTSAVLDGSVGLRSRPMERIINPLLQMGVPILSSSISTAPLRLGARPRETPLRAIDYTLMVASAQVKSCLILAALSADGDVTLREPGPSRDHTERMLGKMGVTMTRNRQEGQLTTTISPIAKLMPIRFSIPGDISSAAFLIVAALIVPNSMITIRNVGLNPTRTGIVDVLIDMGADINVTETGDKCGEPVGDLTIRSSTLHATHVSGDLVVRMIDEFPVFAVAAAFAEGKTVVENAEELHFKESDRIAVLCSEMRAIGVNAEETQDGFVVLGGFAPAGGSAKSHGDHRLAMAMLVAGLRSKEPVIVDEAEYINESFPDFKRVLNNLGAKVKSSNAL
jgi:3-phosphoshikimate 1-carboxyvinyltransferase